MTSETKTVSVVVPIFNEEETVREIYSRVNSVFEKLGKYSYELVFFDDGSTDNTRKIIRELADEHENVKAVFYAKNFGYLKNTFYSVRSAKGDCAVLLHADLQNPPEKIPEFLEKWENGAQVVLGVKNQSRENPFMYFMRTVFYFLMINVFGIKLTAHATEFELFDRSFIEIMRKIKTPLPFLRGIISEYAASTDTVYFTQDKRKKGKSKFNLNKYYDFAITGIVQYSYNIPRRVIALSIIGLILQLVEFVFIFIPSIKDFILSDISERLISRIILAVLLLIFIFLAFISEYIIFFAKNCGEKPMVVEEERINY